MPSQIPQALEPDQLDVIVGKGNVDPPGGINIAFADNHVELVRLERLWNLTWHRNWAAPAKRPGK